MPTTLTCPRCGYGYTVGLDFKNAGFQGNEVNVVVPCPRCGFEFDAAPGDGTYSTIGGRLVRVAEILAETSTEDLRALREDLVDAADSGEAETLSTVLKRARLLDPAEWLSPVTLLAFVSVLVAVLALVLTQRESGDAPTKDQISKLIEIEEGRAARAGPNSPDGVAPATPRNAPCPCGSGRKYKRCHGAPVTSPDHPDHRAGKQ